MVTWQELVAHFEGYTVGGEAIVRINKKHVSLGKNRGGVFAWTPAGLELANSVVIPRATSPATSPSSTPKRGPGRPRKAAIEVKPDAEEG
jgi:hypothetical protein